MPRTMGTHDDEAGSSKSKNSRQYETMEEVLLPQVHHEFLLWEGCSRDVKSRYNTKFAHLLPRHVYSSCIVNWDVLNSMGCDGEINEMLWIKLREAESNEEIFTSFAHRLGLYHADELDEEGFDIYFQGGLRSDEHFNAQEYSLSISKKGNLILSRSQTSYIRSPVLRVMHKMITYGLCQRTTGNDKIQNNDLWLLSIFDARHQNGYVNVAWLIVRWMKRKGAGTHKESDLLCKFITKLVRKARVLSDEVIRSLSSPIYCRDLDTTTLRELIDSEGRLIPEALQPGVARVAIPRPPRASMQDLYERMGNIEIRQGAIERMSYRQSYHWDIYAGAYNPLGYAQPQYDEYY
ncbi:hypothetical protein Tco_0519651 [Tanacetum coccineum]